MNTSDKKLLKIDVLLNRLLLQKSAMEFKMQKQKSNKRKARTRTLIQLGGVRHEVAIWSCGAPEGNPSNATTTHAAG